MKILVTNSKGGSGKTTICTALSVEFAARGYDVSINDLDPQKTISLWHKAGKRTSPKLEEPAVIMFIDTPPGMEFDKIDLVEEADLILIPLTPSAFDAWSTGDMGALVKAKPGARAMVICNRVDRRFKMAKRLENMETEILMAKTVVPYSSAFVEAGMMGKTPQEIQPRGATAIAVKNLVDEILNTFFEQGEKA